MHVRKVRERVNLECDDGNPCTDQVCEGDCVFTPNAEPCDDANACTSVSVCEKGCAKQRKWSIVTMETSAPRMDAPLTRVQ